MADAGAAYGTAKAGMGIGSMGVMHPQLVMRNIIPVVMAGVLGIYGLIVSVILLGNSESVQEQKYWGERHTALFVFLFDFFWWSVTMSCLCPTRRP